MFWWWLGVKIDFLHKHQWSKSIFTPNHHQKNSPSLYCWTVDERDKSGSPYGESVLHTSTFSTNQRVSGIPLKLKL